MSKTAVLTGGGTAGHIYPALALAECLKSRGWDVVYAGTPKGLESTLAPAAGLPFVGFEASGFDRAHPLTLVSGVARIAKSERKAKKWLRELNPAVVVGFGGYVSIPVVRAAEASGIPVVVHEQNSVMGMANKAACAHAKAVCLTYECTRSAVPTGADVAITGNPVRSQVLEASREEARTLFGIPDDAVMLLVFGGSQGARHINQAMCALKDDLLSRENVHVMHIAGPKELASVKETLALTEGERARYQLLGYQDMMPEAMAAADVIVSRSGATSLAEISARKIPALLVPFPAATADHQTTNAQAWVDTGAAMMVADDELDAPEFRECVLRLLDDADLRERMRKSATLSDSVNAADRLADVVCEVV